MSEKIKSTDTKEAFVDDLLKDYEPMFIKSGINFSKDSKARTELKLRFEKIVEDYYEFETNNSAISSNFRNWMKENTSPSSSLITGTQSLGTISDYHFSHLNVATRYWELTSEVPPPPIERDIKTWITGNPADPLWDVDSLPFTQTDSRKSSFIVVADSDTRQRLCPNPPLTVWDGENADLVELSYVENLNTMLGPYLEFGVIISATYKDPKGNVWKAGYCPFMYLTGDAPVDAGRVLGSPRKMSYIRCSVHGGEKGTDFFGFAMSRNGYLLHSATGKFDDEPVNLPFYYGKVDWGMFNMKVITRPDVSSSEWQLTYLPSESSSGRPHLQIKPEHTRTASSDVINWFLQATPFDNMGAELKIREVTGLISFVFDLIIPTAKILWAETYVRPAKYKGYAIPYKYGLRQQFPKSSGS